MKKSTFKTFLQRIAGILLLVAVLFALAAIVGFGVWGRKSPAGWSFAILGLISLAGWFLGRLGSPAAKRDKYAGQRTMIGVNAVASVLILLAILAGVNYMSARHHRIFDLTKNHINSLSGQTTKILKDLKDPLELTYVYAPSELQPDPPDTDKKLLDAYKNASPKIKVKIINAVNDPLELQKLQLTGFSGQPILLIDAAQEKGSKKKDESSNRQQVTAIDEGNVTSAMMKITNPEPKVLYFLGGHGELSVNDFGDKLGQAKAALEQQNYTLKELTLVGENTTIPEDASAVITLAPERDLAPEEGKLLQDYVEDKGHLVLMFDPPQQSITKWTNWLKLTKSLGVKLQDGIVLDFQNAYSSPQFVIGQVDDISEHAVLRSIGKNNMVVLPGVVAMHAIEPAPPSLAITPLFDSSSQSQSVLPDAAGGTGGSEGPFTLAAAIERTESGTLVEEPDTKVTKGMRSVIIANASFITDDLFDRFANGAFFLGSVNWVVGNDALVSIPPKEPVTNTIDITASQRRFITLFSILVLPILCLLIGGTVWWKRR